MLICLPPPAQPTAGEHSRRRAREDRAVGQGHQRQRRVCRAPRGQGHRRGWVFGCGGEGIYIFFELAIYFYITDIFFELAIYIFV